jgi:hypothetical protein
MASTDNIALNQQQTFVLLELFYFTYLVCILSSKHSSKQQCLAFLSISSMSSSSIGGGGGYLEQHLQKTKKDEKQMFFEA